MAAPNFAHPLRAAPPIDGYHDCPGGCARPVPNHLYACRTCWYRLPVAVRRPITAAYLAGNTGEHLTAKSRAGDWYRENPL